MRLKRRRIAIASGVVLLAAAVYSLTNPLMPQRPKLLLAVTDQRLDADALMLSLVASNVGSKTLVQNTFMVRYQREGVWATNWVDDFSGGSISFLLPGQYQHKKCALPRDAIRIQIGYHFEVAGTRVALACRLANRGWSNRVLGRALDLLPGKNGEPGQSWGPEYETKPRTD